MDFSYYKTENFFDELFENDSRVREYIKPLLDRFESLPVKEILRRQKAAEAVLYKLGITFNVYGAKQGEEKIFPFDILPRVINSQEWQQLEKGLEQRIFALNKFLIDIYSENPQILKDKIIPKEMILSASSYRKECIGITPPKDIWIHITGTDLIRNKDGRFFVLEDNLRCPSGVSYVLENREVLKKTFPKLFKTMRVKPVNEYPENLLECLQNISPIQSSSPNVVLLTPGPYNSAYFEHAFLAQQLGIQLCEGSDLVVQDDTVYLRTVEGFDRVDVVYRRIDDDFIDPEVFRKDSLLGVPGLFRAFKKGNVALANAPGTGLADDKCLYAYTSEIIKYYLNEDPIIPIVDTFVCWDEQQRNHVLNNIENLVVKATDQSGGYGILIGPSATKNEISKFKELISKNPRNYIAQPVISLSRAPTLIGQKIEGRHVDCRPYILFGKKIHVMSGGLTRVALNKGSLVVNSSQGGGSKDTWVLADNQERNNAQ